MKLKIVYEALFRLSSLFASIYTFRYFNNFLNKKKKETEDEFSKDLHKFFQTFLWIAFICVIFVIADYNKILSTYLKINIIDVGKVKVSLFNLAKAFLTFTLLLSFANIAQSFFTNKIENMDSGLQQVLSTLAYYIVLTLNIFISLDIAGIDLKSLKYFFSALGIGIGFGLKTIADNFASGIILTFERFIRKGDFVSLEEIQGKIEKIGARGTLIKTSDGKEVIIPNAQLLNNQVTNFTFSNKKIRLSLLIPVSYNSNPEQVKEVLIKSTQDILEILSNPAPEVAFEEFADSSLNFRIFFWISMHNFDAIWKIKSKLLFEIFKQFKIAGIHIPYPQQDIYIKELPQIK